MALTMIEFFAILLLSLFRTASSDDTEEVSQRTSQAIISPNYDHVPSSSSLKSAIASGVGRALADGSDEGDDYNLPGPAGRCHAFVTTSPIKEAISGQGIVFAIKSDDEDDDRLIIRSFGFHIDPGTVNASATIDYEVYALAFTGHYASTERDPDSVSDLAPDAIHPFDFRGDLEESWDLIDSGSVGADDLEISVTTSQVFAKDFFEIPLGRFSVSVPANGGVRSFYITTTRSGLLYSDPPGDASVNDEMVLISSGNDPYRHPPKLLVGEGLALYPMPDSPFFYLTRSFVGKVYYEKECPSPSLSVSWSPPEPPALASQHQFSQLSQAVSERPSPVVRVESPTFDDGYNNYQQWRTDAPSATAVRVEPPALQSSSQPRDQSSSQPSSQPHTFLFTTVFAALTLRQLVK